MSNISLIYPHHPIPQPYPPTPRTRDGCGWGERRCGVRGIGLRGWQGLLNMYVRLHIRYPYSLHSNIYDRCTFFQFLELLDTKFTAAYNSRQHFVDQCFGRCRMSKKHSSRKPNLRYMYLTKTLREAELKLPSLLIYTDHATWHFLYQLVA